MRATGSGNDDPMSPTRPRLVAAASEDGSLTVGLGPLADWARTAGGGVLDGPVTRRLVDIVGDRYSVTVSSTQVVSRGLLRRSRVRWADAEAVVVEPLAAVAARRLVGRTSRSIVGRAVPVPGLRWAAQRVVDRVADVGAGLAAGLPLGLPTALVEVRDHRGGGVILEGPMALTAMLCQRLTDMAVAEAHLHDVQVVVAGK